MKQRDIERVMAAAHAMADAEFSDWDTWVALRDILREVDPHGLYRAEPCLPSGARMSVVAGIAPARKTVNSVTPADDE